MHYTYRDGTPPCVSSGPLQMLELTNFHVNTVFQFGKIFNEGNVTCQKKMTRYHPIVQQVIRKINTLNMCDLMAVI